MILKTGSGTDEVTKIAAAVVLVTKQAHTRIEKPKQFVSITSLIPFLKYDCYLP